MKTKTAKRRIAALLVGLTTAVSFHLSVFSGAVGAEVLDTDYLIYAGDGILVNTEQAVVNGNVYAGGSFAFSGHRRCRAECRGV